VHPGVVVRGLGGPGTVPDTTHCLPESHAECCARIQRRCREDVPLNIADRAIARRAANVATDAKDHDRPSIIETMRTKVTTNNG
jgi:hypothetical protein